MPLHVPDPVARSHMRLRQALGWIGLLLPVLLMVLPGVIRVDTTLYASSISAHYFAPNLGALFVGALWAIGWFLIYYPGHSRAEQPVYALPPLRGPLGERVRQTLTDARVTTLAGLGAIGTATVPTVLDAQPAVCSAVRCSETVHLLFAGVFLGALAYMALFQFTQSDTAPEAWDAEKRWSNRLYVACGLVMVACLVLILVESAAPLPWPENPVFLLEAVAVWAFACAWLVKGDIHREPFLMVTGPAPPPA